MHWFCLDVCINANGVISHVEDQIDLWGTVALMIDYALGYFAKPYQSLPSFDPSMMVLAD